jgi:MFS family permease
MVVKRLRKWWLSPPRSGIQRLIAPPEYRHLRAFGIVRIAGAIVAAAAGFVCLAYAAYGWATFFLIIAALDLPAGYWELTIARSKPSEMHGPQA